MLSPLDVFGLRPLSVALRQARYVFRGLPGVPPSRFGPSSLGIFHPRIALATWFGRKPGGDRVVITNLFNHTQTPIAEGWSVRRSQLLDFRSRKLTYDSHNGTDFAVPPGHTVVAPAPGRVVRVSNEFHRGGIKVILDHGDGLMTTSNHLSRALVRVADFVQRGDTIALSGASGIDALAAFPWNCPHVHFNTWLDGVPVDPFGTADTPSLWRNGNEPGPARGTRDEPWQPTEWDMASIDALIAGCRNDAFRMELQTIADPYLRACETVFHRNYYPTLFDQQRPLVKVPNPRAARLDLPFADFVGVVFADAD
jgi:murein DD-endopeptidase MepM/ murein hydrolase activator NlpD